MSIQFSIPNCPTKVDYLASSVADNGATIPIVNKPTLSTVATSGSYNDLLGKPATVVAPTSVDYNAATSTATTLAITNKPVLATVATSGNYTDLSNRPVVATKLSQLTNDTLAVTGSSTLAGAAVASAGLLVQGALSSDTALPASMTTFPSVAMTSNAGPGGFTATASSTLDGVRAAYRAFDKTATQWACAASRYDSTSGAYVGAISTTVDGATVQGEWVQIQTPVPFKLYNYTLTDTGPREKQWTLAGSTDGASWTSLDAQNIATPVAGSITYVVSASKNACSYFRFIVQTIAQAGQTVTDVSELLFGGIPVTTGDLTVTGTLTVGGSAVLPVTVAAVWYPTANASVAAGSIATYSGTWTQQAFSKIPSGVTLLSGSTITIPYNGIYNVSFSARFSTATGENGLWLQGGSGNFLNRRLSAVDTATGLLNGATTYTGYFNANETVSPVIYSSTANTIVAGNDVMLSLTLLRRSI